MATPTRHFKQRLMLFTACGLIASLVPAGSSLAQSAQAPVQLAQATNTDTSSGSTESIVVRAQKQLLRDKNSPSAVTELGQKAIQETGVSGSIATLLRQAPSVFVYQQGIGNNEPVLTIRGIRGLETAQTLDDVPMQDLLSGGTGAYLQNIIGGHFNLDQISGVSIYPGVAYPDKNTFGTIGGTVAYASKRPENDFAIDVFGSVGSFKTFNEGFTLNSGELEGPLGTGDNAPKLLLQYSNLQTAGFVDYTPARYNNMEFAFDKPYDDGLSKFQTTILYNTGNALYTPEPVPLPYLGLNGRFSNYSPDEEFTRQTNDYLTIILKDETYINDYLTVGGSAFYLNSDSTQLAYANNLAFGPSGIGGSYTVGGAAPFLQTPAGFGEGAGEGLYGPGGLFYSPTAYPYNPLAAYPPGSASCPEVVVQRFNKANDAAGVPCGLNAILQLSHNDTYGFQTRALISPPEIFGITQNIHIGTLVAKETEPAGPTYMGGTTDVPQTPQNLGGIFQGNAFSGGTQRTIYQGYAQDKIDFIDNTLHVTPGFTLEGSYSSLVGGEIFGGTPSAATLASAYCQAGNPCDYGYFKSNKWDREFLPFFNISYDFDKILPVLKGLTAYGSTGSSALFAPVGDFVPNLSGPVPSASIVHLYEGGLKYNTSNVSISADYFYQKVDRDFGFFEYQSGPQDGQSAYNNLGQREFKGVEGSVTWQVTPELQFFGNASHQLAKYLVTNVASVTVQEDQFGDAIKGTPISGVPDWTSNFGVDWTPKSVFRDGDALEIRPYGLYSGHQYATTDLTGFENIGPLPIGAVYGQEAYYESVAGATVTDTNPKDGIAPFVLWNLDVNYTLPTPGLRFLKRVKFDLNLQNLFNHMYFQYFYHQISPTNCSSAGNNGNVPSGIYKGVPLTSYSCSPEFADGIPGEPFSVVFTVSARFGEPPAPPPELQGAVAPPAPPPVAVARTYLVFFDWDRADLTSRAREIVAAAAQASTHVQTTRIEVSGYTDLSGTAAYNQKLSVRRAESVQKELIRDGVAASEIAIHGYGESNPLVPTAPGVREPQNRRVEIVLK
jgi:iron complex outermembrane receptor protein